MDVLRPARGLADLPSPYAGPQLLEVTTQAVRTVINEWSKIPSTGDKADDQEKSRGETQILTRELFEAKRTLISATCKFVELVATPKVREDCFANNEISACLIHNEALRAASDALPRALLDSRLGPSYSVKETAFQKARWNWLEEEVTVAELQSGADSAYPGPFGPDLTQVVDSKSPESLVKRPEHAIFRLAMVGGGRFIVQDWPPALKQAKTQIWPEQNHHAVEEGRVTFMPHNFFDENPVKGADVMNTTLGFEGISPAPEPLQANYGYCTRYSHQKDITMMSIINGIEKTPAQLERIINLAGLYLSKIYDCRSQVSVVRCELPKAGNS
ncbi:hypothetical protein N7491_000229 [Penicillium cf. griseofulvum]|uniref:Uncharacterized protein n=1 Tax=Penicillium cf. griseofulvum TaxID=2972120 RepID=A0A9W9JNL6_9EURO|nr:hypothetical protein N7472_004416 [Penicillium cf. griseofulvum]KAJ5441975.1 hypothetical protein N7445_004982 [Penicillium cf. griseofulvum]KAJ5451047.1 hypothetical protein N7491_000229 [Penicillium cf. griseofulvum]